MTQIHSIKRLFERMILLLGNDMAMVVPGAAIMRSIDYR